MPESQCDLLPPLWVPLIRRAENSNSPGIVKEAEQTGNIARYPDCQDIQSSWRHGELVNLIYVSAFIDVT
jgi:hypothetical protein